MSEEGKTDNPLGVELLEACKATDLDKVKLLVEEKKVAANYERYVEGTWGAHTRESPIHHALRKISSRLGKGEWDQLTSKYTPTPDKEGAQKAVEVVEYLLEHGANVNASYEDYDWRGCGSRETAFEIAIGISSKYSDTLGSGLLVSFLKAGGNPNTISISDTHSMRTDGRAEIPILQEAVSNNSIDCVKALLEAGADVEKEGKKRYNNERGHNTNTVETALHLAVDEGNVEMVLLLLKFGANINKLRKRLDKVASGVESPTDDPRARGYVSSVKCIPVAETPLHIAILKGRPDVVKALMMNGADPNIKFSYGKEEKDTFTLAQEAKNSAEINKALIRDWSPATHHLLPANIQELVKGIWVSLRMVEEIPNDVLGVVLNWVVQASFSGADLNSINPSVNMPVYGRPGISIRI